jgi:protein-S-isoprenylcysteine O-methyltransferase Ste14
LLYGVAAYILFLAAFLYLAAWMGGAPVPTTLDGPADSPLRTALAIDAALILVFGLQHSVMARPGFKNWWTKFVPQPIERSTYVLATNAALALMFWQWRPLGGVIWHIDNQTGRLVMWALFGAGWLLVLVTTFLINHFDLFGLRQVWLYFRDRPYTHLQFVTPGPYRHIRHPLYVGWITAFWATPTMTAAHLVFAAGMTAYILIAIGYEERDLVEAHAGYAEYRRRVPMFVPRRKSATRPSDAAGATSAA